MYSLEEVYIRILEKGDKIGSDYFTIDVVRNRFVSETYDFIDKLLPKIELNQIETDLIKPLIIPDKYNTTDDAVLGGKIASLPKNYYYLLSVKPIFEGGVTSRQVKMLRHGAVQINENDPFNSPTMEYPHITQYADYVHINTGDDEKPIKVLYIYARQPIFADLSNTSERIVDLPNRSIEKLIDVTVIALYGTTADQRVQLNEDVL